MVLGKFVAIAAKVVQKSHSQEYTGFSYVTDDAIAVVVSYMNS
jgi:hypothetical protein